MPLPDVVSGLLLSPRPPVRARAGVPTSKQHHKVISRRKRRPIDRWCCFSFPNRTHFIGLRFGSHRGANTVPFPPHGENCTMLAPSSFSESNPLRWASIRVFKVISRRRRRPIDRWCCFFLSKSNPFHWASIWFPSRSQHRSVSALR